MFIHVYKPLDKRKEVDVIWTKEQSRMHQITYRYPHT